jgi:hypothetical protein
LSPSSSAQQRLSFTKILKQFSDFLEHLEEYLMQGFLSQLSTSILLDVDGQNWEDTKAFFEGERCSYAVQMWSFHLQVSPMIRQTLNG